MTHPTREELIAMLQHSWQDFAKIMANRQDDQVGQNSQDNQAADVPMWARLISWNAVNRILHLLHRD
jgi:hypothetical protein